jgi:hypothetical protein
VIILKKEGNNNQAVAYRAQQLNMVPQQTGGIVFQGAGSVGQTPMQITVA